MVQEKSHFPDRGWPYKANVRGAEILSRVTPEAPDYIDYMNLVSHYNKFQNLLMVSGLRQLIQDTRDLLLLGSDVANPDANRNRAHLPGCGSESGSKYRCCCNVTSIAINYNSLLTVTPLQNSAQHNIPMPGNYHQFTSYIHETRLELIFLQYNGTFHYPQTIIIHNNFLTIILEYNVI